MAEKPNVQNIVNAINGTRTVSNRNSYSGRKSLLKKPLTTTPSATPSAIPIANTAKPGLFNRAKGLAGSKLGIANIVGGVAELGTSMLSSGYELDDGLAKDIATFLEDKGTIAQQVGGPLALTGLIPTPVTAVTGTAGLVSSLAGTGANVVSDLMTRFLGHKKVVAQDIKNREPIVISDIEQKQIPQSTIPVESDQGQDVSYTDILTGVLGNRLDMKAPINPEMISSRMALLATIGTGDINRAHASRAYRQALNYDDKVSGQMAVLHGFAKTINDPNSSPAQLMATNAAANVYFNGLDIYKEDANDMNKQILNTDRVLQKYNRPAQNASEINNISNQITKAQDRLTDYTEKENKELENAEALAVKEKIPFNREAKLLEIGNKYKAEKDRIKADIASWTSKAELLSKDRPMGAGFFVQQQLRHSNSTYIPDWNANNGEVVYKEDLDSFSNKLGLGDPQKFAVAATMQAESGFNSGANSLDSNGAYSSGLIQWNKERQKALADYSRSVGVRPETKAAQLGYLATELKNPNMWTNGADSMKKFFNATSQEEALDILTKSFVRPSKENADERIMKYKTSKLN